MPIPPNPLLNDLVIEGIKKMGEFNPSQDLINRATNQWTEEIKNDIWHLVKKPKILHVTSYTVANQGQSRYAFPTDYSSDLSLNILYGSTSNIAQGGTANTIVLNANDQTGINLIGKEILMMAGVSQGSYAQVVTYDIPSKTAGVIPNWATIPTAGDTYMIIDVEYPVQIKPMWDWESWYKVITQGLPQYAYPVGDDQTGYFVFDKPPDKSYGLRLRYYADLSQIDVNSTLMSVLYRKWRNVWLDGIRMKKAQDEDDDRSPAAEARYNKQLHTLIMREIYGMDLSNITDRIQDYY